MKAKTFLFIILSFASILLYGQNMKPDNLQGSWLGRITTKDFSMRVIFKFNVKNNIIKGYIDCPDQGFKDLRMDKVWLTKDSIFVDA